MRSPSTKASQNSCAITQAMPEETVTVPTGMCRKVSRKSPISRSKPPTLMKTSIIMVLIRLPSMGMLALDCWSNTLAMPKPICISISWPAEKDTLKNSVSR